METSRIHMKIECKYKLVCKL